MCEIFFYTSESNNSEKRAVSKGACDEFGYFEMSTNATNDGVPPGNYKVGFFQSARPPEGLSKPSPSDALGGKYQDLDNPVYTVEIPVGGKKDLTFNLTPLSKEEIAQVLADESASGKSTSGKSKD